VLAIIGEKDTQVPPEPNLKEIEESLESGGNENYTVKELLGLNHLFQTAQTGLPSEYSQIEETISPIALKIISDWVLEQTIGKIDNETLETKVDKIFSEWDKLNSPGCALTVIEDGKIIYKQGYGIANLDSKAPITPATVFDIGSMSKQFTAACILLLAENGKISLDDDIRKYITEFPDYGKTITIRHLLYHTSGIRDYPWLMVLARMPFEDINKDKKQEIINLISRQSQLYFQPGDDYYYSNSNYLLLGVIVERVTGMSLGEYATKNIFEPLGMQNTFIFEDRNRGVENKATGYIQDVNSGYSIKPDLIMCGAGGVNSTVEDLFLWDQNFYENKIGGPNFNNTMQTCGKLNNGDAIKYAFGLEVGEYRGLKTVGFLGYTEGFITYMVRFPEQKFTVICLANLGTMHPNELSMNVADLYLTDQLKPIKPNEPQPETVKRTEITLDPTIYDVYAGDYRFDFGLLMNITKENNRLMAQADKQSKVELFPESETDFFLKVADAQISFNKDENGNVTGLTLHQMGQNMMAKKVGLDEAMPIERLAEFTGDYYNDELQVTYTIILDKDQLLVRVPRAPDSPLQHIDGDKFSTSRGDTVFSRDDQGKIIGFTLDVNTERLSFKFTKNSTTTRG
jgi:CubicO group peptidase (beta-lactamase class C family)